jgi:catalase
VLSPDKMLLGRAFAYADTHRYRIGPNYLHLPVNRPRVEVNTYTQDGPMTYDHNGNAPVYAPNSQGRGYADEVGVVEDGWETDGAMVRQAYTLRPDDDDFGQAGTLVREVWTDEQRSAFVDTVAGHLLGGVKSPVLERGSSTGRTSTPTPASRSRRWCAPGSVSPTPVATRTTPRWSTTRSWRRPPTPPTDRGPASNPT